MKKNTHFLLLYLLLCFSISSLQAFDFFSWASDTYKEHCTVENIWKGVACLGVFLWTTERCVSFFRKKPASDAEVKQMQSELKNTKEELERLKNEQEESKQQFVLFKDTTVESFSGLREDTQRDCAEIEIFKNRTDKHFDRLEHNIEELISDIRIIFENRRLKYYHNAQADAYFEAKGAPLPRRIMHKSPPPSRSGSDSEGELSSGEYEMDSHEKLNYTWPIEDGQIGTPINSPPTEIRMESPVTPKKHVHLLVGEKNGKKIIVSPGASFDSSGDLPVSLKQLLEGDDDAYRSKNSGFDEEPTAIPTLDEDGEPLVTQSLDMTDAVLNAKAIQKLRNASV